MTYQVSLSASFEPLQTFPYEAETPEAAAVAFVYANYDSECWYDRMAVYVQAPDGTTYEVWTFNEHRLHVESHGMRRLDP